jgi:threonyl-tRNA synthetase
LRLLIFHVDSFTCTVSEKGRSPIVETPSSPSTHLDQGLLALIAVEAADGADVAGVAERGAGEIQRLGEQLKAREVVLLPFAHLFVEPGPPAEALRIIDAMAEHLRTNGFGVQRPPFGWFHTWDLKAKGHPLSRVARTVIPLGREPTPS